jgi:uncharacterized membrane protein YkoI
MNSAMRSRTLSVLALLLAALVTAPAHADRRRWAQEAQAPRDFAPRQLTQQRISIEQAIAIVQRETGGRVLDARAQGQQYRIKVLTRGGEVRIVYVDAATGAMR